MHGEEGHIKRNQHDPELNFADTFVEHSSGYFGEPVIGTRKQPENRTTKQYVVQMGHHIICVGLLQVDRR